MLLQLVNFTDTQLRGIWNCLQTTYNELLSNSYQKKKKSLPLSVEYSTDNSRLALYLFFIKQTVGLLLVPTSG